MNENEGIKQRVDGSDGPADQKELMGRIEEALKIYKVSELFMKDVCDDYGKLKIARLRLDFARHQLDTLLEEARQKGIKITESEMMKSFMYRDTQ